MSTVRKALSLWQPWATLVVWGFKLFETRGWPTRYRGDLVIHAGKTTEGLESLDAAFIRRLNDVGLNLVTDFPLGVALGVVRLVSCQRMTPVLIDQQTAMERAFGWWEPGRFAWAFANPRRFKQPYVMRGGQKIFDCTLPVEATADDAGVIAQLTLWEE